MFVNSKQDVGEAEFFGKKNLFVDAKQDVGDAEFVERKICL